MAHIQEKRLVLDWTKAHDVVPLEKSLSESLSAVTEAKKNLLAGTGKGAEMTGWINYIEDHSARVLKDMEKHVERICAHSDALVVVGIGGSLLGAKSLYDALTHRYAALNPQELHRRPLLFWAGTDLATDECAELLDALDQYSPSVLVVSKSGGTTEPALAFRILKNYLEQRFGKSEARARVFCITDSDSGTLVQTAKQEQYPAFEIPKNVGGRYSVFTPVGLLPLWVAGIDVQQLLAGARQANVDFQKPGNDSFETNPALCYAAVRNSLYKEGFKSESLCVWTHKLTAVAEWWKQLFGESDGKSRTGILPTSAHFTTDLHSLGQYFQEGERILFATHLRVQEEYSMTNGCVKRRMRVPQAGIEDGFDFMNNVELAHVQHEAQQATFLAHADGGVPTLVWDIPELNAYWMGYWMQTNFYACAVGGYLRNINPFDQPGVEAYKKNMFALLGKPGHTEMSHDIRTRLERGSRLRSLGLTVKS